MPYDLGDTIAAIASAPGGAARGIVRLTGPQAVECLRSCFESTDATPVQGQAARRWPGAVRVADDNRGPSLVVPGHAFVWPGPSSFTRQPSVEFHTLGCDALLTAVLDEFCRRGARPAEPGEFTLRAFLAGRIDLTQAEAVLGVVDAHSRADLDRALDQLAGGLSRPLHELRAQLLAVLAELEAGLDFADEPLEFISREAVRDRIAAGRRVVAATLDQFSGRDRPGGLPRVALVGPPNAGKSSLFNALVARFGLDPAVRSLVAPQPGATRDYVTARLVVDGLPCELVDVAGEDAAVDDPIAQAAQHAAARQRRDADLRLVCREAGRAQQEQATTLAAVVVHTKCDLDPQAPAFAGAIRCSSVTGEGLDALAAEIRSRIAQSTGPVAATANRCLNSLHTAASALAAAEELADGGSDELLAAEIRAALNAVGEVVGAVCADDVLDRVFSQFCIGK